MTDFQQQAVQLAAQQQSPEWMSELRYQGAEQWLQSTWPGRKTELWKYTPLASLKERQFSGWSPDVPVPQSDWKKEVELLDVDATRLVFVNGALDVDASDKMPEGVSLFSQADEAQLALLQQHLGHIVGTQRHLFASLSNAWVEEGVLLHVASATILDRPLYLVHVSTRTDQALVSNPRFLFLLEDNARANVIEHYASTAAEQNGFVNALTEIRVGANAELRHTRINLEQEELLHIGGVHVDLQRDARFHGFTIAEGSRIKRVDYQANHCDKGAHFGLNGIYLARNRQLVDYHSNIEHIAPHCTTDEVFRGIVGDRARAVFNGRIHIHPDAQKTLAELSNRNLLTSNTAEVDTKPELEIYADDVRCAHGATVSQLDETSLYYLQSRGIPLHEARSMLSFGFVNELLLQVPEEKIRDYLNRHLKKLFTQSDSLVAELHASSPGDPQEHA